LAQGFHVLAVENIYLHHDPESLGYAAVIERVNSDVAQPSDYAAISTKFLRRLVAATAER